MDTARKVHIRNYEDSSVQLLSFVILHVILLQLIKHFNSMWNVSSEHFQITILYKYTLLPYTLALSSK